MLYLPFRFMLHWYGDAYSRNLGDQLKAADNNK